MAFGIRNCQGVHSCKWWMCHQYYLCISLWHIQFWLTSSPLLECNDRPPRQPHMYWSHNCRMASHPPTTELHLWLISLGCPMQYSPRKVRQSALAYSRWSVGSRIVEQNSLLFCPTQSAQRQLVHELRCGHRRSLEVSLEQEKMENHDKLGKDTKEGEGIKGRAWEHIHIIWFCRELWYTKCWEVLVWRSSNQNEMCDL